MRKRSLLSAYWRKLIFWLFYIVTLPWSKTALETGVQKFVLETEFIYLNVIRNWSPQHIALFINNKVALFRDEIALYSS